MTTAENTIALTAALITAYIAEITTRRAIGNTVARSEARWAAVDAHEAADKKLVRLKEQARKELGLTTARPLIRAAREQAEASMA